MGSASRPGSPPLRGQLPALLIVLIIAVSLWLYHRSLSEALSIVLVVVVATALLLTTPRLSLPTPLRLASAGEYHGEHQLYNFASANWWLTAAIALGILFLLLTYYRTFPGALGTAVALVATLALFPYIRSIYPFPGGSNYYVEVLHELWLPAERIALSSGRVYNGYILSSDTNWMTVLLTSKTIVYLAANDVASRSVCQPRTNPEPPPYPPLVPLLYTKPPPTPACGPRGISGKFTFIRSRGESLRDISSVVHRSSWTIISVTNAHEHEELSGALRAYESVHDWNAPTPIGQRFWYYPRAMR